MVILLRQTVSASGDSLFVSVFKAAENANYSKKWWEMGLDACNYYFSCQTKAAEMWRTAQNARKATTTY